MDSVAGFTKLRTFGPEPLGGGGGPPLHNGKSWLLCEPTSWPSWLQTKMIAEAGMWELYKQFGI